MAIDHIDPRDFGANVWTGGDDTAALQAAIDAAKAVGGVVMLPVGVGNFSETLDLTDNNLPQGKTVAMMGPGNAWGTTMLRATENLVIGLDCTGAQGIGLRNFTLGAVQGKSMGSGIWVSAASDRPVDMVILENLYVSAVFGFGALHAFAWGSSTIRDCKFYNYADGNAATVRFSGSNRYNVASSYSTVITPNGAETGISDIDIFKTEVHDFTSGAHAYASGWVFDTHVFAIGVFGGNTSNRGNGSQQKRAYIQSVGNVGKIGFYGRHSFYSDIGPNPSYLAESTGGTLLMRVDPGVDYAIAGAQYAGSVQGF